MAIAVCIIAFETVIYTASFHYMLSGEKSYKKLDKCFGL